MDSNDTDSVRVSLDDDQPPSLAVVNAVAALTNTEPLACPPLYDAVDAEALDALAASCDDLRITFEYYDCQVTVRDHTAVTATPD